VAISDRQISVQCASRGRKSSQILAKERRVWVHDISDTRDVFQLRVRTHGRSRFIVEQPVDSSERAKITAVKVDDRGTNGCTSAADCRLVVIRQRYFDVGPSESARCI